MIQIIFWEGHISICVGRIRVKVKKKQGDQLRVFSDDPGKA